MPWLHEHVGFAFSFYRLSCICPHAGARARARRDRRWATGAGPGFQRRPGFVLQALSRAPAVPPRVPQSYLRGGGRGRSGAGRRAMTPSVPAPKCVKTRKNTYIRDAGFPGGDGATRAGGRARRCAVWPLSRVAAERGSVSALWPLSPVVCAQPSQLYRNTRLRRRRRRRHRSQRGSAVTLHTGPHTRQGTRERRVRSTHTTGDERLYARTSPGTPGAQTGAHSDADSLSQATMKHAPELFACTRGISGDLASLWRVWLWRMLSRHRCTGRCRGQQPCTSRCRRTERRPPSGPGSGAWGSK